MEGEDCLLNGFGRREKLLSKCRPVPVGWTTRGSSVSLLLRMHDLPPIRVCSVKVW